MLDELEVGKCYRHTSGIEMSIVGTVETTLHGWCGVAEQTGCHDLKPVAINDKDAAVGWKEITHEEWLKNFS